MLAAKPMVDGHTGRCRGQLQKWATRHAPIFSSTIYSLSAIVKSRITAYCSNGEWSTAGVRVHKRKDRRIEDGCTDPAAVSISRVVDGRIVEGCRSGWLVAAKVSRKSQVMHFDVHLVGINKGPLPRQRRPNWDVDTRSGPTVCRGTAQTATVRGLARCQLSRSWWALPPTASVGCYLIILSIRALAQSPRLSQPATTSPLRFHHPTISNCHLPLRWLQGRVPA